MTEHSNSFDHDKFNHFIFECGQLSDEKVLLVPGLEFDFAKQNDLHVLLAGLKAMPEGKTAEQVVASANKQGALIIVAHPARNGHYIPENIIGIIDGIELWNATYNSRYLPDEKAIKLLGHLRINNKHLMGLGGLDLHGVEGFRGLKIRLERSFEDSDDLVSLVKQRSFTIRGPLLTLRPDPEKMGFMYFCLLRVLRKLLSTVDRIHIALIRQRRRKRTAPLRKVVL